MIDELFSFPIAMIDGENEERKAQEKSKLGDILGGAGNNSDEEEAYDILFGEAEYPYWDFVGIQDSWLPTEESLEKAMNGKFEACMVRFLNVGQLLVPWTKKKFKSELRKFSEEYNIKNPPKQKNIKVLNVSQDQFKKAFDDGANRMEGDSDLP